MATLQEQRQANGERIQDQRRANGERIQDERRANGERIRKERTGKSVAQDLNQLITPTRQRRPLRTVEPVGALPAKRGTGTYKAPASTGSGIASPLIETLYTDRTYWPETTLPSSDGLLSFKVKPIKEITQKDANNAEVKQQFANPSPAP